MSIGALRQAKHAPAQVRFRRAPPGNPLLPFSMVWDHQEPRAAFPDSDLLAAESPVAGAPNHALSSPLPYGIGIYAGKYEEVKQALPLYFVSEPMAESLGPDIESGWYACATPGDSFELRLTVVQSPFLSVHGKKLSHGRAVAARILVDEKSCNKGYYWFHKHSCLGDECIIPGFVEFPNHDPGPSFGAHVLRPFTFGNVPSVHDAPSSAPIAKPFNWSVAGAGNQDIAKMCISTEVYSGLLRRCIFNKSWSRKMRRVRRAGKTQSSCGGPMALCAGLDTYVERLETNGFFRIFICERSWLQSHNIIDIHENLIVNSGGTDSEADASVDVIVKENASVDRTAGKRNASVPRGEGETKKAKIVKEEPVFETNGADITLVEKELVPETNESSNPGVKMELLVEMNEPSNTEVQKEQLSETNEPNYAHVKKEHLLEITEPSNTHERNDQLSETKEPSNTEAQKELLLENHEPNYTYVKKEPLPEITEPSSTHGMNDLLSKANETTNMQVQKELLSETDEPNHTHVKKEPLPEINEPNNTHVTDELLAERNEPSNIQVKKELHFEKNEGNAKNVKNDEMNSME